MARPEETNKGQSKLHTIRNSNTGEERQVSQEEWRTNGKTLKGEGWTRPDEDATTEEPAPTDPAAQ